jgi:hypothetical protein
MLSGLRRHGPSAGLIILTLSALGLFGVRLNHEFYLRHGPFFDSSSYNETLARAMLTTQAQGLSAALSLMFRGFHTTVVLPWLQAMLVAPFLAPTRAIGVWIQIFWMIVTALAGYVYFLRVANYGRMAASCCALLFFFVSSTFYWDGGVSDFRMDYLQYVFFGLSFYLYSIALNDGRVLLWAVWGGAVALACLARATTPVYIVLLYGPFFFIDLWRKRKTALDVVIRYATAGLVCVALCGWFYFLNASFLHYYYFIWSDAANAHLPLSESRHHLDNVFGHFGNAATLAAAVIFTLNIGLWAFGRRGGSWNIRALWTGIVPVGFLVVIGAGLNPFVSEVAVFGLLLFLLAPVDAKDAPRPSRLRAGVVLLSLVAVAAAGSHAGWKAHTDETGSYGSYWVPSHNAFSEVGRCIIQDVEQGPPGSRTFSALFSGSMNTDVLMNFLIFDTERGTKIESDGSFAVHIRDSTLSMAKPRSDALATPVEWGAVPAANDAEKVALLAKQLAETSDYFIIPSQDSQLPNWVTINLYTKKVAEKLADEVYLKPLCRRLQTGPTEFVSIYRKDMTKSPAGAAALDGYDTANAGKTSSLLTPSSVDSFPGGLDAPGLVFAGVTPEGWLSDKARVVLAMHGTSDRLHITGHVPAGSTKISAGTIRIIVDGITVLERQEGAESFDLIIPIPPAAGTRRIDLSMTGTDQLAEANNRLVSLQLFSIGLESTDQPNSAQDSTPEKQ